MNKLGKLNSSIDIIPLQSSSGQTKKKPVMKQAQEELPARICRDPMLISRVREYLHENVDKIYIDVNSVADYLQRTFRDYRMKKKGSFRAMVRMAYEEITDSYTKKAMASQNDDDEDEDEINLDWDTHNEMLHNKLTKMYEKVLAKQNGNSSDKELIDISSDDEQSKVESVPAKKAKEATEKEPSPNVQRNPVHSCSSGLIQRCASTQRESTQPQTVSNKNKEVPPAPPERQVRKRLREKESTPSFYAKKKELSVVKSTVKFADVGGCTKVLESVCKLLIHMNHPEVFKQLGISPPRGFLLHGPPGCGKTLFAHAIAGELELPMLKVAAPELIAGVSGESEARIRELFDQAASISPCILFLDEIDAVTPHRATAQREMERRVVAQLLSCLDDLSTKENGNRVLVIGATNRPDSLDPALRRAGRFDREVCLGIPDKQARAEILRVHASKLALEADVDLEKIAALCPGFVGADLVALLREAAMVAINRVFENLNKHAEDNKKNLELAIESAIDCEALPEKEKDIDEHRDIGNIDEDDLEMGTATDSYQQAKDPEPVEENPDDPIVTVTDTSKEQSAEPKGLAHLLSWLHDNTAVSSDRLAELFIENNDFEAALRVVQPSAKREGFATVPDVTWDDIGSLQDIRQELQMAIMAPIRHADLFESLGLVAPTGVLLCGPPGCGKTLLAKAVANEAGVNFISVKGPELLNMYVGESEKAVRQCFIRAKNSAPCVIFFDELDALCPKRSEGDNSATSRVVNQMLTEMDGVEERKGVFLMAATNRPDIVDPAVLRPGRLDKILYVGLPTPSDRIDILRALTKNGTKPKLANDVNLEDVGNSDKCDGYTGADLAALIRESSMEVLKESLNDNIKVTEICARHIEAAFDKIRPSVSERDIQHYDKLRKRYSISKKASQYDTPMETPVDPPLIDTTMEAMET
ncbi:nuclear valosin-containing protein-like [Orussus abietinus]|uniref:nuclear valosin-containing protein-like n=1 Tax=Orussus abietinus TaxID=222816 RepID=UPI000C715A89|nr:nuclear valosin-containing protein-like [Orussus abietinus]